ncbi:MAG: YCF48-related protein [Flavobacteriaceae bacterium]|nr:photosystem II stability/assembly factor-like protein [Flavobacteriaceae bacterium]
MSSIKYFFFFLCFSLYAQSNWQKVPNIITNNGGARFDDVFFLTDDLGWAANGSNAAVFKTTDGGLTWAEQLNESTLNGNYYFRNIEFLDEDIGFLGTLDGKFFKTLDGGNNWNEVSITPNPPAICGIEAIGESTIYGCGAYFEPAHIIKSTDKGMTWTFIDMSAYANALVEVTFLDELNGFASGRSDNGGVVLKTTDGGINWIEIYNTNTIGEYVWKLQVLFNNSNVIFGAVFTTAPNPGKLIKSLDGGVTWTSYDAPEAAIEAVGFISETKGWMGGHNTGFFETIDGGNTWTDLNIGGNLNRIFIINNNLAYAAGKSVYKFTDETLNINSVGVESKKDMNIQLTKNPISKHLEFTIDFNSPNNLLIELYGSKGNFIKQLSREIIKDKKIKSYAFNIETLAAGIYILDFHSNVGRTSKKFIKH